MTISFFLPSDITLVKRRGKLLTFDLYDSDGSPLVIESGDDIAGKLWSTDDASPEISALKASSNSKTAIVTVGSSGVTPARVTMEFHPTDTANLVAGTLYSFELYLIDSSDSNKAKTLCRGFASVLGSST